MAEVTTQIKIVLFALVFGIVAFSVSQFPELREDTCSSNAKTLTNEKKTPDSVYDWNDQDPEDYKHLPLKSCGDHSEERRERVIYNRVHKCGGRTIISLLQQLSVRNQFTMITSSVFRDWYINKTWQSKIVEDLDRVQTPFIFDRHMHFLDFTRYGSEQPAYINLIRDPILRQVSAYYFRRYGDNWQTLDFEGTELEKHRTFDECVLTKNPECVRQGMFLYGMVPFFCGQDWRCRKPSEWAVETAIRNVEEHFTFVGLLEEFEDSLAILEKLLPGIFSNVLDVYNEPVQREIARNFSTLHKPKPSPAAETVLKEELKYDYQFYNYVRDKFYETRNRLGIKPST